jgi:DNA-binding response OmpR family regulator
MENLNNADSAAAGGCIMIVDDDPVVAGMLGASLAAAGYHVVELNSGEEALARLNGGAGANDEPPPDIVFLDIEMGMGIDGYETCRRLRTAAATRHLPVIFLSSHDEPDERLCAYDAGGSDFMAKPFIPAEVLRKARLAVRQQRRQQAMEAENRSFSDQVSSALTGYSDSEITLRFNRGALGCRSLHALTLLIIESMGAFDIHCHVQLRSPGATLTLTPEGPASPLEESVIAISRSIDRVFSFQNRLIVNYDSVSLLVTNMPVADEVLCGRIRDQAAVIAEVAELAVGNINLRSDAILRAEELRKLAEASRQAVEDLRASYRDQQLLTRLEFETMTNTIEGMYVHLGLSNNQEFTISDTVRSSVDRVLTLFDASTELDRSFAGIVEGLTRACQYKISLDEESQLTVELF